MSSDLSTKPRKRRSRGLNNDLIFSKDKFETPMDAMQEVGRILELNDPPWTTRSITEKMGELGMVPCCGKTLRHKKVELSPPSGH